MGVEEIGVRGGCAIAPERIAVNLLLRKGVDDPPADLLGIFVDGDVHVCHIPHQRGEGSIRWAGTRCLWRQVLVISSGWSASRKIRGIFGGGG